MKTDKSPIKSVSPQIYEYIKMEAHYLKQLDPECYFETIVSEGVREDGRTLNEPRTVDIKQGILHNCFGSALVSVGQSCVICGINVAYGVPSLLRRGNGEIEIRVDLNVPSDETGFRTFRQSRKALQIQSVLESLVNQAGIIDKTELAISDDLAWKLIFCLDIVSSDGNLVDCSVMALISSLKAFHFPAFRINSSTTPPFLDIAQPNTIIDSSWTLGSRLERSKTDIVSQTVVVSSGMIVVDPSRAEEGMAGQRAVMTVIKDSRNCILFAISHNSAVLNMFN